MQVVLGSSIPGRRFILSFPALLMGDDFPTAQSALPIMQGYPMLIRPGAATRTIQRLVSQEAFEVRPLLRVRVELLARGRRHGHEDPLLADVVGGDQEELLSPRLRLRFPLQDGRDDVLDGVLLRRELVLRMTVRRIEVQRGGPAEPPEVGVGLPPAGRASVLRSGRPLSAESC